MGNKTVEIDGEEYLVSTEGSEPTVERLTPTLTESFKQFIKDHPSIRESSINRFTEVEKDESIPLHVDLVGGNPGSTNIGTGRTDAYKDNLAQHDVGVEVRCFEEYDVGNALHERGDVIVSVKLVDIEEVREKYDNVGFP